MDRRPRTSSAQAFDPLWSSIGSIHVQHIFQPRPQPKWLPYRNQVRVHENTVQTRYSERSNQMCVFFSHLVHVLVPGLFHKPLLAKVRRQMEVESVRHGLDALFVELEGKLGLLWVTSRGYPRHSAWLSDFEGMIEKDVGFPMHLLTAASGKDNM